MIRPKAPIPSPAVPSALLGDIRALIDATRQRAVSAVNSELTMLYWRVGQRIHTQVLKGRRADYGEEVLPTLAAQLVKDYGGSFAVKNLRRMVQFAATWQCSSPARMGVPSSAGWPARDWPTNCTTRAI